MTSCYYDNTSDLHLSLPSSSNTQQIFPPPPTFHPQDTNYNPPFSSSIQYPQNPRKKRTKMLRIKDSHPLSKPNKPHPSAPMITRPCTECGKKFWSWKALFGHMRCHPERQWRGINPPPNFKKSDSGAGGTSYGDDLPTRMTDDDYHVATCLLMLANGQIAVRDQTPTVTAAPSVTTAAANVCFPDTEPGFRKVSGFVGFGDYDGSGVSNIRFECSSCKKVFGSHQALGGHRASHKNVKGCFAITRTEGEEDVVQEIVEGDHDRNNIIVEGRVLTDPSSNNNSNGSGTSTIPVPFGAHQCGICFRVFSSGQALGGHKRCHWDKLGDELVNVGGSSPGLSHGSFGLTACDLDLNMAAPAPVDEARSSVSYTSDLALDLRLGL